MFAIGVNPWIWTAPVTDQALAALLPRLAGWGFDAVELPLAQFGDWSPQRVRDLLAEHGLTAAAVIPFTSPERSLVRATPDTVRATQDHLRSMVDVAVMVGAPTICGPMYATVGQRWPMSAAERRECYAELRRALEPVAEHAAANGVRIGLEPLNRYDTSVLNTVAQGLEALDGLPDTVGLMIDSYHMNIEESDPYGAVALAGPRLVHVQVSGSDRGAPGSDHIDWPRWLDTLAGTGYRGPICIESFTGEIEEMAVAAAVWRPLAPSQDRLATDGLAYLRRLTERIPA
ncbi:sugar phosphate isomerase/epimerase family protein [Micromonospora sp. NPDC050397]|uniref:sugar phosphate isomerase/epimerase family protein n=1 Tax=Micromonospora sp. NPDC050397 TaxID=3364279 RepID=UPI00384E809A